ncbi:glycosyltransferase [Hahella sp. KA22]|uniref:glycosyltransferase family 4 protein n=1 Tax=Hahella sp. KA22 TaxID=1628392 RepID=UPI000FDF0E39|nr:glycosyltransferase family 4 protein [Hahella sp. KA22]AZZ92999.1 glycosyltransferase family 1 protein [Hahella sp. KA22]QAY56373.1 glycosyltransferase [Hahella sp. KA22]
MKNVLHIIDTTGPGGAETVFIQLIRNLSKDKYQHHVILRGEGWVADQVRESGIEPVFIDSKGSFNLGYAWALVRFIRSNKIDVIHAHLMGSNVYGALVAILTRKPMIATFHGGVDVAKQERLLNLKFKVISLGADSIICVSKKLEEELKLRGELEVSKLKLIYNGVDPNQFSRKGVTLKSELGLPEDAIVVLSVGNIRPAKGYEYLVDAAAKMKGAHEYHFVVVGHQKKSLYDELLKRIDSHGGVPHLHFLGFRSDVKDIMGQADIFLLTSTSEGFSIATVEAMMAGVPVVATRSGGPEEILEDGVTGLLIPVKDPEAVKTALLKLRDEELVNKMRQAAQQSATEKFSLVNMVGEYETLYDRLSV